MNRQLTDEQLLSLLKQIDYGAVRVPSGVRKLANLIWEKIQSAALAPVPEDVPKIQWATCPETGTPCSICPTNQTQCHAMAAAAEVPMPEPDITTLYSYTDSTGEPRNLAHTHDQMRTYGAACRAAGEAAGYIKGVKAENKRCKQILIEKMKHYDGLPERAIAAQCFDHAQSLLGGCAYDAAMRGEECDLPPRGWRCTRSKGHEGPCAAVECPWEVEIVERAMKRLRGEEK